MIESNLREFLTRIAKRASRFNLSSSSRQALLSRIGIKLSSEMAMNATRQNIVDFGALRQSIKYQLEADSVTAGSFGVRYARYHEFGATLPPRAVRAMFASMKRRHPKGRQGKGVFKGNPRDGGTLRARPFVSPAFKRHSQWVIDEVARWAND
jgi:hypothetical protein